MIVILQQKGALVLITVFCLFIAVQQTVTPEKFCNDNII